MTFSRFLGVCVTAVLPSLLACGGSSLTEGRGEQGPDLVTDPLTGITGVEREIRFQSYVYVPVGSNDDAIKGAIARQVKTALGSLRAPKVAMNDRDARSNLDPAKWTREVLAVVDPTNPSAAPGQVLKVTFPYVDRAVATTTLSTRSALDFSVLFNDYAQWADDLRRDCSDDASADTGSLWYHFQPQRSSCQTAMRSERAALDVERKGLSGRAATVGPKELNRRFLQVNAQLAASQNPGRAHSPEYDRLYGLDDPNKTELVIYAFMGVDGYAPEDTYNPDDALALEAMKLYRTLLRGQPNLRPVHTEPFEWLLDLYVDGNKLQGVTYEKLLTWIIDRRDFPPEVGNDLGKIAALRRQAISKFAERRIEWKLPLEVRKADGSVKRLDVRLITFYGQEDGTPQARQHAQWRYLEAFWHGDVFLYNGHSHFGHGPLEPTLYHGGNFNSRYQVMFINSCISFNYYHQDFFELKPGGTQNLDMVVNGLPSYVHDGGVASARFLLGLLSPQPKTYPELLESMRLDMPWGEYGYDPIRVADGELDNTFSRDSRPLTVTPGAPVYP